MRQEEAEEAEDGEPVEEEDVLEGPVVPLVAPPRRAVGAEGVEEDGEDGPVPRRRAEAVGAAVDLDEGDLVLLGESGDELLVDGVVAVLGEDAQVAVFLVEGLADLVKSLDEAVNSAGVLQDSLDSGLNVVNFLFFHRKK